MKLEPKAKPVRIRIKSGGEEHFNLESLKRNFSVQDLWEAVIGKSLSRWLKQQDEKELADGVDGFCEIEKPSVDDYVRFSNLFFANETIVDADSLLKFYQSKGLKKNVRSAFLELFDSLSFENGKQWYDSFKHLKKNEEWVDFFEHSLTQLSGMDEVDCYGILASLYKEIGNVQKMDKYKTNANKLLLSLAREKGDIALQLLETGDYDCVKALFGNSGFRNEISDEKWISAFRRCQESLEGITKGECLFCLYTLYQNNNETMARMCLKMSEDLGYHKTKQKSQSLAIKKCPHCGADIELSSIYCTFCGKDTNSVSTPESVSKTYNSSWSKYYSYRYPELVALFQHLGHNIMKTQLDQIATQIWDLAIKYKSQKHYENCYYCINMFLEIQSKWNYNTIPEVMKRRAQEIQRSIAEVPLIFLVAGLAWEEKSDNTALFRQNGGIKLRSDYRSIVEAKGQNQYQIITTKNGMKCDTAVDSPIDQMIFFMMSYDEGYEISNRY